MRAFLHLKSSKGFSLPELMVSSAIGVIVALGIATVFIFSVTQFQLMIDKSQAEENALLLSFYSRVFISQAVDLRAVDSVANVAGDCGTFPGELTFPTAVTARPGCQNFQANPNLGGLAFDGTEGYFDYNFESRNHFIPQGNGDLGAIAIFNREWGTATSELRPAAIYFRDYISSGTTPEQRSKIIVFAISPIGAAAAPGDIASMSMTFVNAIEFDRVTKYEIQKIPRVAGSAVDIADPDSYCLAIEVEPKPRYIATVTGLQKNASLLNDYPKDCLPPKGAANFPNGVFADAELINPGSYKVKALTIDLATRYFRNINKREWDYSSVSPAMPSRDVQMNVKIAIKNNVLSTNSLVSGSTRQERVHGGLYFFKPIFPRLGR